MSFSYLPTCVAWSQYSESTFFFCIRKFANFNPSNQRNHKNIWKKRIANPSVVKQFNFFCLSHILSWLVKTWFNFFFSTVMFLVCYFCHLNFWQQKDLWLTNKLERRRNVLCRSVHLQPQIVHDVFHFSPFCCSFFHLKDYMLLFVWAQQVPKNNGKYIKPISAQKTNHNKLISHFVVLVSVRSEILFSIFCLRQLRK